MGSCYLVIGWKFIELKVPSIIPYMEKWASREELPIDQRSEKGQIKFARKFGKGRYLDQVWGKFGQRYTNCTDFRFFFRGSFL